MITEGEYNYDDFEKEALDKLKRGVSLEDNDGGLAPLLKRLLDASKASLKVTCWKEKPRRQVGVTEGMD